jgi:hypothetical protein
MDLMPISPVDDLDALIFYLPPWMRDHHGKFIVDRLKEYVVDSGGNRTWNEITKARALKK